MTVMMTYFRNRIDGQTIRTPIPPALVERLADTLGARVATAVPDVLLWEAEPGDNGRANEMGEATRFREALTAAGPLRSFFDKGDPHFLSPILLWKDQSGWAGDDLTTILDQVRADEEKHGRGEEVVRNP